MSEILQRLHKAIAQQQRLEAAPARGPGDLKAEAAFRPVRDAAIELRDGLANVPDLKIAADPDSVRIELYDKRLWFSYDPERQVFVGSEVDSLWMEGGLREQAFTWPTAEACIEALIQVCARYVSLAEAIARLRPAGGHRA